MYSPRYFMCVFCLPFQRYFWVFLILSLAFSLSMYLVPVGARDSLLLVWLRAVPADCLFAKYAIWPRQVYTVSLQLLDLGRGTGCRSHNVVSTLLNYPINSICWSMAFLCPVKLECLLVLQITILIITCLQILSVLMELKLTSVFSHCESLWLLSESHE